MAAFVEPINPLEAARAYICEALSDADTTHTLLADPTIVATHAIELLVDDLTPCDPALFQALGVRVFDPPTYSALAIDLMALTLLEHAS